MDLQISWRNLWRNPRRTAAVLGAVTTGIWALIFILAFGRGFMLGMIDKAIDNLTGHIQIHAPGYIDQPDLDHSMHQNRVELDEYLTEVLPTGSQWSHRIRLNTVVSNARHSGGVTLIGSDWETETDITFLRNAVIEGEGLSTDDPFGIVVGRALLEKFETKIGNKLILMAQDTTGEVASQAFRIRGVFDTELEATEKQFAFITLDSARQFLSLSDQLSEISIRLPDSNASDSEVKALAKTLNERIGEKLEVKDWLTLQPAISGYVEMSDTTNYIIVFIIFIAMGFGLVNTMLMAVHERVREFGLVKALGMHNWRIIRMVLMESVFLFAIGLVLGNLLGLGTVWYFSTHGIDLSSFAASAEYMEYSRVIYFSLQWSDFFKSNLLICFLGVAVSLYPAIFAAKFTPIDAMRHVQ